MASLGRRGSAAAGPTAISARARVAETQRLLLAGAPIAGGSGAPELVPFSLDSFDVSGMLRTGWALAHVKWMLQKDRLNQDMFLIGATGPMRRWLALRFCEVLKREVEIQSLTRDTTEADLKQRREIGAGGTITHVNQAVVNAAIHGRILILEGLEKVERNVLPILNNLLENREMQLEDGSFLVAPKRFDELLKSNSRSHLVNTLRLIRVHEGFRVIALGVPVPPFPGNPLDPPLRSRFQARHIDRLPAATLAGCLKTFSTSHVSDRDVDVVGHEGLPLIRRIRELLEFYETVWQFGTQIASTAGLEAQTAAYQHMLYPGENAMISAATLMRTNCCVPFFDVISRIYPAKIGIMDDETLAMLDAVLPDVPDTIDADWADPVQLVKRMSQSHAIGRDLCLIGDRGEGKSYTAHRFAAAEHYSPIETLHLYKDMTARDLLLRRTTTETGETVWQTTPLLEGMKHGRLVILDGIDRLALGTIAVLLRLIEDREIVLFDGSRYLPSHKYVELQQKLDRSDHEMSSVNTFAIHPRFRILALANPPQRVNPWLTNEMMHLFHFFSLGERGTVGTNYEKIIVSAVPRVDRQLVQVLCKVANELAVLCEDKMNEITSKLSLRQLLRICRRSITFPTETGQVIRTALLMQFLPATEALLLRELLDKHGLNYNPPDALTDELFTPEKIIEKSEDGTPILRIGTTIAPIYQVANEALVPDVLFFDIPKHVQILEAMLKDIILGEHILLIGNQGVGKNKLCDHLLQLLNREREYIQLHRDTTVQSLTLLPSLRNGVVIFEDSPLVKAMVAGRVLMIDEFDKAPTEVVCILKGLLEDGEVLLSDGRRFISRRSPLFEHYNGSSVEGINVIHDNFRVFALANRPGYPFLGNDFYREMGDIFACHVVDNPDLASEIKLLQGYGPDVPVELIERLSRVFKELRMMMDEGMLSYPYSTRELVNIVRHMQRYPEDNITIVLENLFAFDVFDPDLRRQISEVFQKHGIPLGSSNLDVYSEDTYQIAQPSLARESMPLFNIMTRLKSSSSPCIISTGHFTKVGHVAEGNASWKPIADIASARAKRYSEEVLSLKVPHHGEVLGLASIGERLFALTDTLELYEFNIQNFTYRQHSLVDLTCAKYSWGGPLINPIVSIPSLHAVCTYDILNRNLILAKIVGNHELIVTTLPIDLHPQNLISPRPVGILQLGVDSTLALYAINGNRIVFVCCTTGKIASVELSGHLQLKLVEPFGMNAVLVTVHEKGKSESDRCQLVCHLLKGTTAITSLNVMTQLSHASWSIVHFVPTQVAIESGTDESAHDYISPLLDQKISKRIGMPVTNVISSPAMLCGYTTFNELVKEEIQTSHHYGIVSGHLRLHDHVEKNLSQSVNVPFLQKRRCSLWLQRSSLLATAISSPAGVAIELFDPISRTVRVVVLAKNASDNTAFLPDEALKNDVLFLRNNGMPHVSSLSELGDGRLAILLANHQVRILEVREDQLDADSLLWDRLTQGSRQDSYQDKSTSQSDRNSGDTSNNSNDENGGKGSGKGGGGRGEGEGSGEGSGNGGRGSGGRGQGGGRGGGSGSFTFDEELVHMGNFDTLSSGKSNIAKGMPNNDIPYDSELVQQALEKAKNAIKVQQRTYELADIDEGQYGEVYSTVQQEILQMRVVLEGVEAKEKERVWLKNQVHGDLDDNRLVDSATGDKNVYKKRGENDMMFGAVQSLPKRLLFLMDVSSSMSVMNADGRLDRLCATAVLIMESFSGLEHKFQYAILGHSGDSDGFPFVNMGKPPKNRAERLEVIRKMYSHATYCGSGDNTLPAAARAVSAIVDLPSDDYFVFLISDANLSSYGISPKALAEVLLRDERVNSYAVFIANKSEADQMKRMMPAGRAHTILDTREMPRLFRQIFASAVLR